MTALPSRPARPPEVLVEASGLADPEPLARAFWVDEAVGSSVHLDGVVAVVDASRIVRAERPRVFAERWGLRCACVPMI